MIKYRGKKVKQELDRLISGLQLKKQVADIFLEGFKTFLYVDVDKKYERHAPFTQVLLYIYIDSSNTIMNDPDAMSDKEVFLSNNITELLLLEDQTSSQYNRVLVAVVALLMLCYSQSECSNIVQGVNT